MPLFDLSGDELTNYRSAAEPPADLAAFWQDTLAGSREKARPATVTRVANGLTLVDTYDVTFSGFDGDPIRAWFHRPAGTDDTALPVVVRYQGYGGGRGLSHQVQPWLLAGYACLQVDTRGQGSGYSPGHTPDPAGSAPAHPGYLTRGILDPATYYYRRVFTDAVLAVDAAQQLRRVDASKVAVAGGSQGGGIALAVAGLRDDLAAVLADVPFLADFRRASEIAAEPPYTELTSYLAIHRDRVDQVFETLAYFDVSVLGTLARPPRWCRSR